MLGWWDSDNSVDLSFAFHPVHTCEVHSNGLWYIHGCAAVVIFTACPSVHMRAQPLVTAIPPVLGNH